MLSVADAKRSFSHCTSDNPTSEPIVKKLRSDSYLSIGRKIVCFVVSRLHIQSSSRNWKSIYSPNLACMKYTFGALCETRRPLGI